MKVWFDLKKIPENWKKGKIKHQYQACTVFYLIFKLFMWKLKYKKLKLKNKSSDYFRPQGKRKGNYFHRRQENPERKNTSTNTYQRKGISKRRNKGQENSKRRN